MRKYPIYLTAFSLLFFSGAGAQLTDLRLPISLDADSTDYDGKNSMLMFRGLRLTQGNIGIEADEGRASNLDFENSVWQFIGNVVIDCLLFFLALITSTAALTHDPGVHQPSAFAAAGVSSFLLAGLSVVIYLGGVGKRASFGLLLLLGTLLLVFQQFLQALLTSIFGPS